MKERIAPEDYPEGLLNGMRQTQDYIDNSGLDYKMLELMRMRVSQINSCAYCIDMHYKKAIHAGETPLRLLSVSAWRETPYYTPKEQAILAFAEQLTHMPQEVYTDDIHNELKSHCSKQEKIFPASRRWPGRSSGSRSVSAGMPCHGKIRKSIRSLCWRRPYKVTGMPKIPIH